MGLAALTVKKTTLELGGKSPTIVFKDAYLDAAVKDDWPPSFSTREQMCVAGSRLLVENCIHDEFLAALVEKTGAIRLGKRLESETNRARLFPLPTVKGCRALLHQA